MIPWRLAYWPVRIEARFGEQSGVGWKARVKTAPSRASRSMCGVRRYGWPPAPNSSNRRSSTRITTRLERVTGRDYEAEPSVPPPRPCGGVGRSSRMPVSQDPKEVTMRTRSRLVALLVGLSLVGAAALAAAAPVTLTFRFNDAEHKELREALDVFEKQNPNIKVTLQRIAWADSREQFLREAAVGQGPDVVHLAQTVIRNVGQAGALLKL